MKKLFMMAAVACCSVMASAQVWIGGGIGFSSSKSDATDDKTTTFVLQPTVGYDLNEKMSVGASLYWSSRKTGDADAVKNWQIAPFFRYNAISFDKLTLFADAKVTFSKDSKPFAIGIYPGFSYAFSDQFGITSSIGLLKYEKYKDANKGFYFDLNTEALNISLYYKF